MPNRRTESTEDILRGGCPRKSDETAVMGVEQRGAECRTVH